MRDGSHFLVTRRILIKELGEAQRKQDILCPMLSAMLAHYKSEGVLDEHLTDHVQVLMSELWNSLAMMDQALKEEEVPF